MSLTQFGYPWDSLTTGKGGVNIVWPSVSLAGIGIVFWLLWAWISGSDFNALGASAEEWSELMKTIWTAVLLVTPAGAVALGTVNVLRQRSFLTGK